MAIFHSYVKLPEGNVKCDNWNKGNHWNSLDINNDNWMWKYVKHIVKQIVNDKHRITNIVKPLQNHVKPNYCRDQFGMCAWHGGRLDMSPSRHISPTLRMVPNIVLLQNHPLMGFFHGSYHHPAMKVAPLNHRQITVKSPSNHDQITIHPQSPWFDSGDPHLIVIWWIYISP